MANWGTPKITNEQGKVDVIAHERVEDTNPKTYFERGKIFEENGDYESAEQEYEKAVKYSGEYVGIINKVKLGNFFINYGKHLEQTGNYTGAEDKYKRAFELKGADVDNTLSNFYGNMGEQYFLKGDYELAEEQYIKAIQVALPETVDEGVNKIKQSLLKFYYATNWDDYEVKADKLFFSYVTKYVLKNTFAQIFIFAIPFLILHILPIIIYKSFITELSFACGLVRILLGTINLINTKRYFINEARGIKDEGKILEKSCLYMFFGSIGVGIIAIIDVLLHG